MARQSSRAGREAHGRTVKVDRNQLGRRYIAVVSPRFEHGWTVQGVTRHYANVSVLRDGQWVRPLLVTVAYFNGQQITEESGTTLAIDLDVPGVVNA
jgi:hypothetical protein